MVKINQNTEIMGVAAICQIWNSAVTSRFRLVEKKR